MPDEPGVPDSDPAHDAAYGWLILDEAGFPACVLDRRLRYRRANAAWRQYLEGDTFQYGRQRVSLHHRELLSDVPDERRERWAVALQAIVEGRLGHFVDRAVERSSLGDRHVLTTASPTINRDGLVDGVLCVRYDVTDAHRAAENAERLERVLLTARRLQHFLGNQLALTLGYVELLTIDPRLPDDLRDRVAEALRGVVEASETLAQLRRVTRLEIHHDDPSLGRRLGPTEPP